MDARRITQILAALEREGVAYKVFGAIALNVHGIARGTQDLDLFVRPEPDNIARLRAALRSVFDEDPNIDEITYEDLAGDYPAIQYVPPDGVLSIDILTRLGDTYDYDALEAVRGLWDHVPVSVVSPRQLYEMKRDTVRWKDKADAQRLRERFGLEE
jgi:hypothetical protein